MPPQGTDHPHRTVPGLLPAMALFALAVAFYVGRCLYESGALSLPIDDGWIHLNFARSLAEGKGFRFDPGVPVSGSTAPLWTFLLALPLALGVGPVAAALGLGLLSALAAIFATHALGTHLAGSPRGGLIAGLGLALAPRFLWGTLSGMEVPLFTLLVVWAVLAQLRARNGWSAPLLAGVAGWTRPECFAIAALLILLTLWRRRRAERRSLVAAALPPLVAGILPLLAWVGFHLLVYGKPLPSTFYVKAAAASPFSAVANEGLSAALPFLLLYPLKQVAAFLSYISAYNLVLCAGAALALLHRRTRRGALLVAGVVLFFGLARGVLGYAGPWVQHGRYYTFLYPLLLALSAAGLAAPREDRRPLLVTLLPHFAVLLLLLWVWQLAPGQVGKALRLLLTDDPGTRITPAQALALEGWLIYAPLTLYALLLAATTWLAPGRRALTIVAALGLAWYVPANLVMAEAYSRNVRETGAAHVAMGRYVADQVPTEATIACHDIGALGYFGRRKLLDLAGIATPEVLSWKRGADGLPDRADFLRTRRPDYLCFLLGWYTEDIAGLATDLRSGALAWEEIHRISQPGSITIGGEHYVLIRLHWKQPAPLPRRKP